MDVFSSLSRTRRRWDERRAGFGGWPTRFARPWAVVLVAVVAALVALDGGGAAAQQPASVSIVTATHSVDGHIVAALRAQPHDALDLSSVTVTVDGIARAATTKSLASTDAKAITIVIDTSGSMAGEPIVAARRAVSDMIRLLPPQDQIAIVAFSDAPRVLVPFTTDRAALLQASESLIAAGSTALYEAVAVGSELLAAAPQQDRRLVLLSDGLDFGGLSKRDRAQSIAAARTSKSVAFAFGFGKEADREYLAALAKETGGRAQEVVDVAALRSVFVELGGLLGATHEVTVTVPVAARGEHLLALAASAAGTRVTSERRFTVTNEGLLTPRIAEEPGSPGQIVVQLGSASPLEGADVKVVAGDRALTVVPGAERVVLDPWGFKPGRLELQVAVSLAGAPVASTTFKAEVPALAPSLVVSRAAAGGVFMRWRVQAGGEPWTVRAVAAGQELGRWQGTDADATVAIPDGNPPVQVELLRPDGSVATQQTFSVPSSNARMLLAIAAVLLLSGGAGLVWLRRRPAPTVYTPTNITPMRRSRGFAMGAAPPPASVVVLRGREEEARYDIGQRPLTIGSAQQCDIVLTDEGVRPFHARLTLDRDGVLRVHGLSERAAARGGEPAGGDQWVLLERGAELGIGEHLIRLESA